MKANRYAMYFFTNIIGRLLLCLHLFHIKSRMYHIHVKFVTKFVTKFLIEMHPLSTVGAILILVLKFIIKFLLLGCVFSPCQHGTLC